jgi:hypothetical protein
MVDQYIAVRGFTSKVREKQKEELKDWKVDFDKGVSANLNAIVDYPAQTY